MSQIQEIQNLQREQEMVIRDQLTKLVLSSNGLKQILNFLSQKASNPVFLTDCFFNPLTYWSLSDKTTWEDLISRETKEQLKNNDRLGKIVQKKSQKIIIETVKINNRTINLFMKPIYIEKFFFGWLILVALNDTKEYLYRIIMEQGSTVLALELYEQKNELKMLTRTKEGFFYSIVKGKNLSPQEMQKRIRLFGIDINTDFVVMLIHVEPSLSQHHFSNIESYLISYDPYATLIEAKDELIVFFHPNYLKRPSAINKVSKRVALKLHSLLKKDGYSCNIGIGRFYKGIQKISIGYREAKLALQKAIRGNHNVLDYHDLGLERLFSLFPDNKLIEFSQDVLENLLDYDKKNKSELYKTLYCYLSNNQNMAATSRDMSLHINTVNYRLKRIQDILEIDLNNVEIIMTLYFAIKVNENIFNK